MFRLKTAKAYKPEVIPDENKIRECLNNIGDVLRELPYCSYVYIFEQINDIIAACGIDSEQEG